ncbi:helix-turn-helix domain-containing protein [Klebsiella aerogenes]
MEYAVKKISHFLLPYMKKTVNGKSLCNKIYFIKAGFVVVKNQDNVVSVINSNQFIGLQFLFVKKDEFCDFYFEVDNQDIYETDIESAKNLLLKKPGYNLYLAKALSKSIFNILDYNVICSSKSSYERILETLKLINKLNSASNSSIPLMNLIITLSGVSKSRVYHIVSELKRGDYISIHDNSFQIKKKLPKRF